MADVPLMNNPMTTAGDVMYGGASGAPTRLAAGTADQVLTMNAGATAPEWANASTSGTASAVKVYRNTTQALSATTLTAVQFNAEELDTDGYHESVTNPDRITIPTGKGGVFMVVGYLYSPLNGTLLGRFTVGGTAVRGQSIGNGNGNGIVLSAGPVALADGDIVRLEAWLNGAGNIGDATNTEQQCWASLTRIGD